ncbi:hypothetical protein, partial [Corynebacterium sp.]|uniref:hypothetical protein n=1 Tax=Corynebacterium sp. TaxID=1720 RepID=UPI002F42048E
TDDGLPGPLTTAHVEDTMTKLDDLLAAVNKIPAQVWRETLPGPGYDTPPQAQSWLRGANQKAGNASARSREAVALIAAQEGAIKVLAEAVATQQGINADQLQAAVKSAMNSALANLTADVKLTVEEAS